MSRLTALRGLLLASFAVVGWDAGHYFKPWPFGLGIATLAGWIIYCAFLYCARDLARAERPGWRL